MEYSFTKEKKKWNPNRRKRWYLYHKKGIRICAICREYVKWEDATLEHLTPKSMGGGSGLNNVSISHGRCNSKRGVKPLGLLRRMLALEDWYKAPVREVIKEY